MPEQAITPQLREWIIGQAQSGHAPEVVLKAMLASGWQQDVAIAAMEDTLRQHLQHTAAQQALPGGAATVPDPLPPDGRLYVDAGDRQVAVLQAMEQPHVVVFGNVLSPAECEQLIELARPRLARSLTVSNATGGEEVNDDRTSQGMFFQRGENDLVQRIEARIAHLLAWPVDNGEGLQILRYAAGAEYKPHYDYFDPAEPGTPTLLARGGQRVATLILYLGEPERGGATVFPDVHLQVAPKRGHGVFFSYAHAHPSSRTLHGGAPVLAGEKWIATKWLRERRFD